MTKEKEKIQEIGKQKETRKWMEELNVKQNIIEKDGNQTIVI